MKTLDGELSEVCECLLERRKQFMLIFVIFIKQIKSRNYREILVFVTLGFIIIFWSFKMIDYDMILLNKGIRPPARMTLIWARSLLQLSKSSY